MMQVLLFIPTTTAGLLWYFGGLVGQAIVVAGIVHVIVLAIVWKAQTEAEQIEAEEKDAEKMFNDEFPNDE
jgi:hypothetical protein